MLIIIEGVDGSGKSTLASKLAQLLGEDRPTTLLHRGPLKADPITEYITPIEEYRPSSGRHVICDRWHVGEDIYGPLYRGESKMTTAMRIHVEKTVSARGGVLVLMTSPLTTLHQRWADRGEDFLKPEHAVHVMDRYYELIYASTIPAYNLHDPGDDALTQLVTAALAWEDQASILNRFRTYVGSPAPRYLILGEKHGSLHLGHHDSAFVPYPATSGAYLLGNLPQDVVEPAGLANACQENVMDLWVTLGQPLTVTLGVEAHKAANEAGVPHGSVPHPQFIRRFHNKHGEAYGRAVRDALLHGRTLLTWRP